MHLCLMHYLSHIFTVNEKKDLSGYGFCITSSVNTLLFVFFYLWSHLYLFLSVLGQGWIGWRNDTRNGQPIEIKFEFDKVREFTSVHIFCNNQFTRDVQVSTEYLTSG